MTMNSKILSNPAAEIEIIIRNFCRSSPENNMHFGNSEPIYEEPLVGFSAGNDTLYTFFKKDIGIPFMAPEEHFRAAFPDIEVNPKDLTVISWVLPLTRRTKDDNRKETKYPSERWARTRLYGEEFNVALRKHVIDTLESCGIASVAPEISPVRKIGISEKYGIASTWSERHAAFVSGLGTFGLCDGLITQKGKAMRCGSVIARISIPPTIRPYTDHHAWCLFYAKGVCKACIKRCPSGAISELGHDKNKCSDYSFGVGKQYVQQTFGLDTYGCGHCQTGVPCESKNPVRPLLT